MYDSIVGYKEVVYVVDIRIWYNATSSAEKSKENLQVFFQGLILK